MRTVSEPARDIPVCAEVDVLVCGGGPAGLCAAIAAARTGVKALLLERYGFLGGMLTAGLVITIKGFGPDQGQGPNRWRDFQPVVRGIPEEIVRTLNTEGAAFGDIVDPEAAKSVLDQIVQEAGVDVLLHSMVAGAIVRDGRINGIIVENKSGRSAILAKVTVDATGDGDVACRAGAACAKGRDGDGAFQPMTPCFTLADVRYPWNEKCRSIEQSRCACLVNPEIISAQAQAVKKGELPPSCLCAVPGVTGGRLREDHLWINAIWQYGDATDARQLTRAEIEGRQKVRRLVAFYKGRPGCEAAYVARTGAQIGVRESRRVCGEYALTEKDILDSRRFDDSIAKGCWQIDIHSPDGGKTAGRWEARPGRTYDIPYRCLTPRGVDGLLVAGRCISTTHEAHSSVRVMGTCMAVGHAAGAAAALAARTGVTPGRLAVGALQETLRAQGASL